MSATVLILGCGMQGRAVAAHLADSPAIGRLVCADVNESSAAACAERYGKGKAQAVGLDASDEAALRRLIADGVDVVVDMLPRQFVEPVVHAAMAAGVPVVNTYYDENLRPLAPRIAAAGIAVLPEMGMDPGIDLVLCRRVLDELDEVDDLLSFGGAVPEPAADDNPLHYKISWTWEGVLNAYTRPARLIRDGRVVEVSGDDLFDEAHLASLEVEGLGWMEATPNGDVQRYAEQAGLRGLRKAGRYAVRWPGHAALWRALKRLGFLDLDPVPGLPDGVSPRRFMVHHLGQRLRYRPGERDLVVVRVEASGRKAGRPRRVVAEIVDWADRESGLSATARTVGFPASIGAQFLLNGAIERRGLLSPLRDVPPAAFIEALDRAGISVRVHASVE